MKSRAVLIGVVAAIVAVAAYLWRARASHEEGAPAIAAKQGGEATVPAPRRSAPPAAGASGEGAAADSREEGGAAGDEDSSDPPEPRDHRGAPATHPRPHRPGEKVVYPVAPAVIADLRRSLRPVIKRCGDEFAADLSPGARIQGSLGVAIHGGALSVLDVEVQSTGVPESSGLIECARKAFAAAALRADGHADVERHVLRFPFQVPVK